MNFIRFVQKIFFLNYYFEKEKWVDKIENSFSGLVKRPCLSDDDAGDRDIRLLDMANRRRRPLQNEITVSLYIRDVTSPSLSPMFSQSRISGYVQSPTIGIESHQKGKNKI